MQQEFEGSSTEYLGDLGKMHVTYTDNIDNEWEEYETDYGGNSSSGESSNSSSSCSSSSTFTASYHPKPDDLIPALFSDIEADIGAYIEELSGEEIEELFENDNVPAAIHAFVEKVKLATEEQEEQLREKAEELRGLKETFEKLEQEFVEKKPIEKRIDTATTTTTTTITKLSSRPRVKHLCSLQP
ncbi:hypothetical protein G9A89_002627 [Geosiphon pyriformis]|nr:hypothetical protein G9A89_002627 [Geosiphon pyriformis]